jgi:hypothetical protein
MQFMISNQHLHVSAPECHPQVVHMNKGTQVKYANPGIDYRTHEVDKSKILIL